METTERAPRPAAAPGRRPPPRRRRLAPRGLLLTLIVAAAPAPAHEVPGDVTVRLLVRPEGETLRLLARVPLEAMQEETLPTTGRGLLDLVAARERGALADAASLVLGDQLEVWADGRRLPPPRLATVRISLPSDRSFDRWESALAHLRARPLPDTTRIPWKQAMLDAGFEVALPRAGAELAIRPRFERLGLRVRILLRATTAGGETRAFELHGDPGKVPLDPRWHQVATRFLELGFFHILAGADHLLFLACLAIPLRRLRDLVLVVTAFTVAHSITLVAAALGAAPTALWFPPLVELLIAASIVWMAFENLLGLGARRRWAITFAFGLVHGFGFSFALAESLQLAGGHLAGSLLAFNLGVELGQVFVLVLAVPVLALLFRAPVAERWIVVLLSALVAHTAWHWMAERAETLAAYRTTGPLLDALPASALPWLALMLVLAVPASRALRRRRASATTGQSVPSGPSEPASRPSRGAA